MSSFSQKKLRVKIALNQGNESFDSNDNNMLTFEDLRVTASIQSGNGSPHASAQIMIYNLSQETINRISKLKWGVNSKIDNKLNYIQLEASNDGGNTYAVIYAGTITYAVPNFGSTPDVILVIDSISGFNHQLIPVPPVSFNGEVDVAFAIEQICKRMNMQFENNGVSVKLSNPYLPQTALQQVKELCKAANIDLAIEMSTVAIMSKGSGREVDKLIISPTTGLEGYPTPSITGVSFRCLFDPKMRFKGLIEIKDSIIELCNGEWVVNGVTHFLESEVSGGRWFSEVQGIHKGSVKVEK